jgi:mono/diheme cytochrome c family protein
MKRFVAVALCATGLGSMGAQADDGALFAQYCSLCHQTGAVGLPGQYPRLAGRLAKIGTARAGRTYLIDVLTFGMSGQINVDGQPLFGLMPPFAQVGDDAVAGILSYVQTLGDSSAKAPAAFTAAEVTARRNQTAGKSIDVHAERQALDQALLQ